MHLHVLNSDFQTVVQICTNTKDHNIFTWPVGLSVTSSLNFNQSIIRSLLPTDDSGDISAPTLILSVYFYCFHVGVGSLPTSTECWTFFLGFFQCTTWCVELLNCQDRDDESDFYPSLLPSDTGRGRKGEVTSLNQIKVHSLNVCLFIHPSIQEEPKWNPAWHHQESQDLSNILATQFMKKKTHYRPSYSSSQTVSLFISSSAHPSIHQGGGGCTLCGMVLFAPQSMYSYVSRESCS